MPRVLYLIDAFSLIFQVFHALPPMTSPKGEPTGAIFGFIRDLQAILKDRGPSHLVVAWEGGGTAEREILYPEYKANRSETPPDLISQIPRILEVVEAMNIPTVSHDGWEADDVIATLATRAVRDGFDEVRIVTNDKDARQLIGPRTQLLNCRKNQFLDLEFLEQDWGIRPEQVTDFQGLVGDSTDNIPGVPQVGPAAAKALLTHFGTLAEVLDNLDDLPAGRVINKSVRANLATYAEQARLSQKLATLQTALPISFDWDQAQVRAPDIARLKPLYSSFGFRRFTEELAELESAGQGEGAAEEEEKPLEWSIIDTPASCEDFLAELRAQRRVCFDLETSDIDAMRATIVGWAFCWQAGRAFYLPVQGPPGQTCLDGEELLAALRPILEDPEVEFVNQNLKYELLVLRNAGVNIARIGVDPMVGDYLLDAGARSHGLDALAERYLGHQMIPISKLIGKGSKQKRMFEIEIEQVAEYAAEDAEIAWRLAHEIGDRLEEIGMHDLYWELERPIIRVLAGMEFNGIRLDVAELERQSEGVAVRLEALTAEIHDLAGKPFNVNSPKQLQKILFDGLGLPIIKRTKTGPSTDAEVLERLAGEHPLPARLIDYRMLSKLQGTYLQALPRMVNPRTGKIHCSFNQVVASTGRLSSSEPNLQNVPIRTDEGRRIRKAFIPSEPGWQLLSADYSQVELRVLAHFSRDEALLTAFRENRDVHAAVAADIFHVSETEVTAEMRRIAKTVNFGVIYGQSPFGLATTLQIPKSEAAAFIDQYLARYASVATLIQSTLAEAREKGYVTTILGRRRQIAGIRPHPDQRLTLPERTAFNAVIQGSAADLIKQAMINLDRRLAKSELSARLLLQIHDELVLEAPEEELSALEEVVREEMSQAIALDVPLRVDINTGVSWYDAK